MGDTEVLEPWPGATDAPPPRRRGGRVVLVVVIVLAILAALLVVADAVARGLAEEAAADRIEQQLPDGVEGEVTVTIGGLSVLVQALAGTASEVRVDAPELLVQGTPIAFHAELSDVPIALDGPVGSVRAEVSLDEASLNELVRQQDVDGGFRLGEGSVGYDSTLSMLGIPIPYSVTATPEAAGGWVLLRPEAVEVGPEGMRLDVTGFVTSTVLGGDPLDVCVASYLPEGFDVVGIEVEQGSATVDLAADDVRLDSGALSSRGSCG